ncbi:GYF domain containing protein [Aphelenchoides avenae]|nr:GYF domain containing protein [Aphelenchus avenae]
MSATVMPTDSMRMNFNPSWNQQSAAPTRAERVPREPPNENDTSQEMATPVFAKNRYGREDLLALMAKDVPPPDGLEKCKYISEQPQTPVVLTGQTESEQRYQNNINSSKAISSLPQNQRQMFAGSSEGQGGPPAANSWQTVGGTRNTGTYRPPGGANRWSGLQPGQDTGGSFNRSSRGGTTSSFGGGRGGSTQRTRAFGGGGRQRGTSINEDGGADGAAPQTPLTPVNGGPPAWGRQESRTDSVGGGGGNAWQRPEPKPDSNPWRPVGGGASANPPEPGSATAPTKAWQREPPSAAASAPSSSANTTGGDNGGGGQGFNNSGFTSSKSPSADRTFAQPQKPPEQKQPSVAVNRTASIPDAARQPPMPSPQQDVARQISQMSLSSTSSPPAPPAVECQEWVYLDPRGNLQGPFTNQQMQAWFANGYFKSDLMLRRADETQFTNLGK